MKIKMTVTKLFDVEDFLSEFPDYHHADKQSIVDEIMYENDFDESVEIDIEEVPEE